MNIESFFYYRVVLPRFSVKKKIKINAWIIMNQYLVTRLYILLTCKKNLFLI